MVWFVVIGVIGLLIVLASLVLGELFEGLFEAIAIDAGGGLFSTPVIGAFLAAFGFGGALATGAGSTGVAAATGIAAVSGVSMGGVTFWLTRAVMRMPTDPTLRVQDLVGHEAVVVSPILEGRFGEVSLVHGGQRLKMNARAELPIPLGATVIVVSVNSTSSVVVEEADRFWALNAGPAEGD